ncbi:haloacid dehalogenase-like hydrolase [bacterium]|nr:haloacid dehalogenase-like hydrolase [bacterium]
MQNVIAIVFDFDDTLAPDSTSSFLKSLGIDIKKFWSVEVQALIEKDWDPIPAYLYKMIERSKSASPMVITKEMFINHGKRLKFHPGVNTVFNQLKKSLTKAHPKLILEFYLISSGILDIVKSTKIAHQFTSMWACDFEYNKKGEIIFPKKIVSFTDKTRYIFQISKGIYGADAFGKPFEVNKKVAEDDLRIPLDQMIFVGDGYTDIPCFSLLKKNGGCAIGVYDKKEKQKWGRAWGFIDQGRVSNLVSANYSKDSDLSNSLAMAIEGIASKISLKKRTYQR